MDTLPTKIPNLVSGGETEPSVLDPLFLFDFRLTLAKVDAIWANSATKLTEKHTLPNLNAMSGRPALSEVRVGWSSEGLAIFAAVRHKQQTAWCRSNRLEDSDGIQILLDTRATPGVHRATRFAHRFVFTPFGGGTDFSKPVAYHLPVGRARENPKFAPPEALHVSSVKQPGGYDLHGAIPAKWLTGYDPKEYQEISLHYTLVDRERGAQTLTLSPAFPILDDPTLWVRMRLASK